MLQRQEEPQEDIQQKELRRQCYNSENDIECNDSKSHFLPLSTRYSRPIRRVSVGFYRHILIEGHAMITLRL